MDTIAFVVLHYENVADTAECVESLLKYIRAGGVHVVVVDNGSRNGRLDGLQAAHAGEERLHFIRSEDNLGFARGNNLGFRYAKHTLGADCILLCNNDLVFRQEDFTARLRADYARERFDVAGPHIESLVDGKNQNPVPCTLATLPRINDRLRKLRILRFLNTFDLDVVFQKKVARPVVEYRPGANDEYMLHGSCLIFGPDYVSAREGLYDGTFMYCEEDILRLQTIQSGMTMRYLDDIRVWHKEGSSVGAVFDRTRDRRRFFYKWSIDSCKKLKRMMTER